MPPQGTTAAMDAVIQNMQTVLDQRMQVTMEAMKNNMATQERMQQETMTNAMIAQERTHQDNYEAIEARHFAVQAEMEARMQK